MLSKIIFAIISFFALFQVAVALPSPNEGSTTDQCNTGSVSCCNSIQDASSPSVQTLLGLLGVALGSVTGQVGVNCSPISAIGLGGNSCSAQPVCCTSDSFSGLVNVGCTPINLNA